jgi:phosphatidate cytidylyltransferase
MDLDKIINISNNFLKRFYSILFLIPIYFYSVISKHYLSTLIIFITSLILSFEWFKITQKYIEKKNIILFSFLIFLNIFISTLISFFYSIFVTLIFLFLILSKIFFKKYSFKNLSWLFYGFVYITIPLIIFLQIKKIDDGNYILLWVLIIICITDIFSYIFGNLIKGPKIFPNLSPSKTYSGTFLGIVCGSFFGVIYSLNYLNLDNKYILILFSVVISLSGQFGDLFMSKIKRNFHVKDSGSILPGHGGFLDRYDSISFGLIAIFFIQYFL